MSRWRWSSVWQQLAVRRCWLGWGTVVLAWFVVVYGGCNWLTSQRTGRVQLHLDAELGIPIVPAAVYAYLSLNPLMLLSGWVLDKPSQWRALAWTMMFAIGLAGLGFLALPANLGYAPWQDTVPASWHGIFHFTESLVGSHNLFPSLHVALALICAAAYCRSESDWLWPVWSGWTLAITAATLFTHQHHLIDVVGGLALGWLCMATVHRRLLPVRSASERTVEPLGTRLPAPPV